MIYTNFTRPDGPRRNLLTYSDQFDNAGWAKTRASVVANIVVAPDGTLTGDKVVEDTTASDIHIVNQNVTPVGNTTYTYSIYVKAGERTFAEVFVGLFVSQVASNTIRINLLTGEFSASDTSRTRVENVGNGWWRVASTITTIASPGSIGPRVGPTISLATGSYTGDGTSGIYIWGAQLEVGSTATEYQPVVSGLEFSVEPLNHALIGWQNLAFGITPTASSSATGKPAIAAAYPTTFEYWQPTALPATWAVDLGSAQAVDYFGLVGDMNGATVALQSSTNNSTWTTQQTQSGLTDRINMFLFLPVTARYWRLYITGSLPSIAVVYIGKALAMQRKIYQGHSPLTLSRDTELSNNVSDGGQYLGRSIIRQGASTSFGWQHLKADWYRANFDPFVQAARVAPFFIAWRPEQYPSEMGFVWTGNDIKPANTGPRDFMGVDMTVRGLINE
jgi:hypothetical protein